MGNSLEEKSPTVKLVIWWPAVTAARISAAILRISDPTSPRAMLPRPRRGSGPSRSSCSFSMSLPPLPAKEAPIYHKLLRYNRARVRLKALVWIVRQGPSGPEVLLLERPSRRGGGDHPVTGKAHHGETARACAGREALEETGLRGELLELEYIHRYRGKKGPFEEHAF